jgi:hypothetical protein
MSKKLEARGGIEPPIKVLQTFALPLGDRAFVAGPAKNKNTAGIPLAVGETSLEAEPET